MNALANWFNTIPIDLRSSGQYVEFNNARAGSRLARMPAKILVLAQKTAAGTGTTLTPIRIDKGSAAAHAAQLAGRGSMGHLMVKALVAANGWTDVYLMLLADDDAGVAASGSITFNAAAPAAATFTLRLDGTRVRIALAAGQTAEAMATALAAAINAEADLPVTAAVDGVNPAKVVWTCRWKGETGNDIDVRAGYGDEEAAPAGLNFTLAAMSGGAANPDIGDAISAVANDWYTDVVCPYTDADNLAQLDAEGERRWGGVVQMDWHAYVGRRGTQGELASWGNGMNYKHVTALGAKASPSATWRWAATLAGICAFEAGQDPARPYQTLALPRAEVLAPLVADRFMLESRNALLKDGVSTWWADDDGTVRLDNIITMYQRNAYGFEDTSYLQIETKKTLGFIRYSMRARIAQRFPRHKLAGNATPRRAGDFLVRPVDIADELIALAGDWQDAGLVEDIEQFKSELVVDRDGNDPNRVNAIVPPNLVNQFRVFAARVDFIN